MLKKEKVRTEKGRARVKCGENDGERLVKKWGEGKKGEGREMDREGLGNRGKVSR